MPQVKARLYLSASIYTSPTIFLIVARLNLHNTWLLTFLFLIFVFIATSRTLLTLLHCLFSFDMKTNSFMINYLPFLCYFFHQSIQFWCFPFVQSSLFPFYYLSFHLSSHLYKDSYGSKFFISFVLSWALNEISHAATIPRFSSNFTVSEKQLWLAEDG